jgi:rare lipoprotein A
VFTTEGQPPKTGPDKATALLKRERKRRSDMGVASYYGAYFAGRETANGETFDPWAMTAAHRLLPLGTVLRVTNLDNGREVEVRVNDRGPYRHDRIIDVSHGAARRLGFEGSGVARVRLEVLKLGDGRRVRVPARRGERSTSGPLADAGPSR